MNQENNPILTANAQTLRRNMTKEERKLWYVFLKKLPVTINRQKVLSKYILDFYCASAKIAIELDGSQHYEEEGHSKDEERDQFLKERGITVLRYSNREVNFQFRDVCEDIRRHLIRQPCGLPPSGESTGLQRETPLKGKARSERQAYRFYPALDFKTKSSYTFLKAKPPFCFRDGGFYIPVYTIKLVYFRNFFLL